LECGVKERATWEKFNLPSLLLEINEGKHEPWTIAAVQYENEKKYNYPWISMGCAALLTPCSTSGDGMGTKMKSACKEVTMYMWQGKDIP
jgi:hypothetical protein